MRCKRRRISTICPAAAGATAAAFLIATTRAFVYQPQRLHVTQHVPVRGSSPDWTAMGRTCVGKNLPSCQSREFPECSLRTRGSTGLTCSSRSGGAAGIPLRNRAPRCPSPTFASSFSCHDAICKPLLSLSPASFSIVPSSRLYASSLPSPKTDEEEEPVPPDAWRLLALSFLCMIICSLDRVAMSVAILPMSLEFGFSGESSEGRRGGRKEGGGGEGERREGTEKRLDTVRGGASIW